MTPCRNCKKGHYVINGNTGDFYGLTCNECGDRKVMDMQGNIADSPGETLASNTPTQKEETNPKD